MIGLLIDATQKARRALAGADGHDLFPRSMKVVAGTSYRLLHYKTVDVGPSGYHAAISEPAPPARRRSLSRWASPDHLTI